MGYTHYYEVRGWRTDEWQAAWPELVRDSLLILEAADVLVTGPTDDDDDIVPPVVSTENGIIFNGVADDGHEPFYLTRRDHDGFVKTLQKPYDSAVACILLRAYLLAPDNFILHTDGLWGGVEWLRARQLYRQIWPEDAIRCPWEEAHEDDGGDHDQDDKGCLVASPTPTTIASSKETCISEIMAKIHLKTDLSSPSHTESTILKFDMSRILSRIRECEEEANHSKCKASPIQWQNLPGVRFKLIDVKKHCVVEAPDQASFVVLSYVWGGVDQPKLTANTASLLMREGGLNAIWSHIPATVRDAMTVCEKLGERYLWVDALCIMQDSVRDMKIQILRMRQIYSAAKFTIVAASAETADTGLLSEIIADRSPGLQSVGSLHDLIESCPWSSRAWCYQEKVLSHRVIFFTQARIYWQCQHGTYNSEGDRLQDIEDMSNDRPNLTRFNRVGGMLCIAPGDELESYISAVEYYSQRKLTKAGDRLNAFQGVIRRYGGALDGQASSFCFGLPICAFDQTSCWRAGGHYPHLRNNGFPSWSWLGWSTPVTFDRKITISARTSHMIHGSDEYYDADTTAELRKPVARFLGSGREFGFPTSLSGQFYNSPERSLLASVADLIIASSPTSIQGSNGLYAVYPAKCGKPPPPPPPRTMTVLEALMQPMPEFKIMDKETAAAPSVPGKRQTAGDYTIDDHSHHGQCEAKTPLGYMWLDTNWRDEQPVHAVMQFMALAGEKDVAYEGQWIITMLMCVQRMEKNGHFWAFERLQVMDCNIKQQKWLDSWAEIVDLKII